MPLPEHLAELLVRLVDLHEAKGRVEFYVNQSNAGCHVSYAQGPWFPVPIADLQDLRDQKLIRLTGAPSSGYRGAPTLLGIDAVARRADTEEPNESRTPQRSEVVSTSLSTRAIQPCSPDAAIECAHTPK